MPSPAADSAIETTDAAAAARIESSVRLPHANRDALDQTLLVGIDEAGYGPLLGPLVVSAVAFDMPMPLADASLWNVLSEAVCNSPRARDRRIAICDSKKLHRPDDGIGPIERTALAAFAAWSDLPSTLHDLLARVAPHVVDQLARYPWHRSPPALPLAADAGSIRIAAQNLCRAGHARDVLPAGIWCEPLFEEQFNRRVDSTNNKAAVLVSLTLRLMQRVGEANPGRDIRFLVDRQGGRAHYGSLLMQAFEGARLRIVEESADASRYQLKWPAGTWSIDFLVRGDSEHLPIALASIVSKYVREACMASFNAFWKRHIPGLAPTAGYYVDGQRFLKEISPILEPLGIDPRLIVRQR